MSYLTVDLDLIEPPTHPLREVDRLSVKFRELVESIRDRGVQVPPKVTRDNEFFVLVDGCNRVEAAKAAGLTQIPVEVIEATADEADELMFELNAQRIETRPVDFARFIQRQLDNHPGRTLAAQAAKLHRDPQSLSKVLKLSKLEGQAADLVNEGKVSIEVGVALAKLQRLGEPLEPWLERAHHEPARELVPEIKAAIRKTKKSGLIAKLRPLREVKAELERREQMGDEFWIDALKWVLKLDPVTQAEKDL